jgi:hypothetical protein
MVKEFEMVIFQPNGGQCSKFKGISNYFLANVKNC